jgi:site-specific DNA-methyltransferase (adenine-specific)
LSDHKLILGDCLDELPKIFDKNIYLVLTDPPYGTTACKWDFVIPFEPMWNQLKRVIKDNGCIALFGSEPFSSNLRMSNIKQFKYDWVWQKEQGTGFGNAKKQPLRNLEIISIFYKNQCLYNPQKSKGKPYKTKSKSGNHKGSVYEDGGLNSIITVNEGNRFPLQLLKFNRDKNKIHPTQKPVALLEYLIKSYTNENDTVLDFTMGSGSTGVACKNLNRNFIGIEKDEKYFDIAKQRIEGVLI